ncbi:MAG: hypothetical protein V3V14_02965 [Saprospiraceae bacterium]
MSEDPKEINEDDKLLDLKTVIEDLEKQQIAANGLTQPLQKYSMSAELEDIKKSIVSEPDRSEVIAITTKIHSFDKPVFVTLPRSKVYTIFGKVPTLRTPEISTENIEIHIMNNEEMAYSVYSDVDIDDFMEMDDYMSMPPEGVFVICGKNFGTRKLDALASILLKLDSKRIIVQKYSYNKNNRSAQWVPKHNKQMTKLEHHIYKFLRNND